MKEHYISHPQDLSDAIGEIKKLPHPYVLMGIPSSPTKEHGNEYEKKRRLQAYFFRSVVPTYAECAGVDEERARMELLRKFGRVEEIIEDDGEWVYFALQNDRLALIEEGKRYRVLSVGAMSNATLSELINKSKDFIMYQFGVMIPYRNINYKTKEI